MPMSENIPDNDDLFREAYNRFEEEPSPGVWDKLDAQLNKEDAQRYRNKFAWWRTAAIILLLLFASVITYDVVFNNAATKATTDVQKNKPHVDSDSAYAHNKTPQSSHNSIQNNTTAVNNNKALNNIPGKSNNTKQPKAETVNSRYGKPEIIKDQFVITAPVVYTNLAETNINNTGAVNHQTQFISNFNINSFLVGNVVITSTSFNKTHLNTLQLIAAKEPVALKAFQSSAAEKIVYTRKPHWSFSPFAALDIPGEVIDDDDHYRGSNEPYDRDDIDRRENQDLSYSTGLLARYHFNNRLSLKSGAVYSNTSIGISPQTLYATDEGGYKYITSSGYGYVQKAFGQVPANGDSISAANAEHHLSYLSVPLMVSYTIHPFSKLSVRPGAGINTPIFYSPLK